MGQYTMNQNKQRYTCVSKPGEYELVGTSSGAGTMKGFPVMVYRDVQTGRLFHREPENFMARMKKIPAEPAINHEMLAAMQQARQWIAENSGAETAPAQLHLMDAMIAKAKGEHPFDTQVHGKTIAKLQGDGHLGGDA